MSYWRKWKIMYLKKQNGKRKGKGKGKGINCVATLKAGE